MPGPEQVPGLADHSIAVRAEWMRPSGEEGEIRGAGTGGGPLNRLCSLFRSLRAARSSGGVPKPCVHETGVDQLFEQDPNSDMR